MTVYQGLTLSGNIGNGLANHATDKEIREEIKALRSILNLRQNARAILKRAHCPVKRKSVAAISAGIAEREN